MDSRTAARTMFRLPENSEIMNFLDIKIVLVGCIERKL
jgi:hypothetical protein